ncbi:glycosyltransferase family 4 protein [Cytobacillus firmus]|uniref:glycosyltransferase family 4 protein n=1 Tax=Cytobacillus firmus TaxID=1399 RepID=UPI0024C16B8A|nr:glycosyltransferase family 4 protein [Cytobacillus firmus]WHY33821.1 glycosyltransferase family 4 protein [Cytobacillus firmus]
MEKTRLVFAGHDLKFALLIINHLEKTNKFEIRFDQWSGHNTHDEQRSIECLNWADVIICEWGLGNAVWYSHRKLPHQKLIVRMHRQELDTVYPTQFINENINVFIAISPFIYEEFYRIFKLPRDKTKMIYNVLDASKLDKPKINAKYNLGIIGIAPKMKRLDLALDLLEKLWMTDHNYKLFVKGKKPEEYPWLWRKDTEREYYEELYLRIERAPWKSAVIFDGFGEIDEWLQKIGFVLSTSDFESFHLAPSEGMASGAIPLILKWDGSETIYKEDYLYDDIDAFANRIIEINKMESSSALRKEVKEYARHQFDIKKIGKQWEELIDELLESK